MPITAYVDRHLVMDPQQKSVFLTYELATRCGLPSSWTGGQILGTPRWSRLSGVFEGAMGPAAPEVTRDARNDRRFSSLWILLVQEANEGLSAEEKNGSSHSRLPAPLLSGALPLGGGYVDNVHIGVKPAER